MAQRKPNVPNKRMANIASIGGMGRRTTVAEWKQSLFSKRNVVYDDDCGQETIAVCASEEYAKEIVRLRGIGERVKDVEGLAKYLTDHFKCKDHDSVQGFECSNCGNISVHDRDWEPVAAALSRWLLKKEG